MNNWLLIIEAVVIFSCLLIAHKVFGKTGLFVWIGIAPILANIEVAKAVDMFGVSATLGNIMFASTFLATDILTELYGKEEAKKGVFVGAFTVLIYIISTQFAILYEPNEIDTINKSMTELFSLAPRICSSSLLMFVLANVADVYLYDLLRSKTERFMWVRNNVCTIICNCLENFGFSFLAFYGVFPNGDIVSIALATSVVEILVALMDTPFLYLARHESKRKVTA